MARVSIDILGITELTWTRMGGFNSDDHHTMGKNLLEEWSRPRGQQESETQYLGVISKMTEWTLFSRQAIQYHSNASLCPDQ